MNPQIRPSGDFEELRLAADHGGVVNGNPDEHSLMEAEIAAYIRSNEPQYQPSPEALALGASVGMSPAQVRRAIAMEAFLSLIRDPRRPHG